MSCVRHCWDEVLLLDPVIERRFPAKRVAFRCRFCARDHATHDLAEQCAKDCKNKFSARFALEIDAWGLPHDEVLLKRTRRKFSPQGQVQVVPVQPMLKRKTAIQGAGQPKPEGNAHPEEKEIQGVAAVAESKKETQGNKTPATAQAPGASKEQPKAHAAKEAPGPDRAEEAHAAEEPSKAADTTPTAEEKAAKAKEPFTRSGAQYICSGCQKKYFTRAEVEKCFASHISS